MYGYTNIALGKEMHYMYKYTHIYVYNFINICIHVDN